MENPNSCTPRNTADSLLCKWLGGRNLTIVGIIAVSLAGCCCLSPTPNPSLPPTNLNLATLNVKGPVTLQGTVPWQISSWPAPSKGPNTLPVPAEFSSNSTPRWVSGDGFTVTDGNPSQTFPKIYVPGSSVNFQANVSFTDDTSVVQVPYTQTSVVKPCSSNSDCASGVCQAPTYCAHPPYCGSNYCTARTVLNSMFPGVLEGNHAHYTLSVQRWDKNATSCAPPRQSLDPDYPDVRFDVPSPTATSATTGGTGCWVDLATGTTELFGSSVGPQSSTTAAQDGTVSAQLGVVVNLNEMSTYVRYVVTVSEGDTRVPASTSVTGWGPGKDSNPSACNPNLAAPYMNAVCQLSDTLVRTYFPFTTTPYSLADMYDWTIQHPTSPSSFSYSTALNPFQTVVQPVALAQLKVLPYTLLYMPPGNASKATFATTTSFGVSMAADSKLGNNVSTTVDNKNTETIGITNNLLGAVIGAATGVSGVTIADSYTNATSWDKSTKTGVGNSSDVATNQSTTYQSVSSFTLSNPGLTPGASGTYASAPFWSDTFVLLIHPQVGFWQLGGIPVISLLAAAGTPAAPDFFTPTVADLDQCYRQVPPFAGGIPIPGTTDILTQEDCHQLLQLDPFYGVGQNAPSLASNPRAIPAGGTDYGVDPSSGSELNQSMTNVISYSGSTTVTRVGSYNAAVTDVLTSQGTGGINLGIFGISGSDTFQSAETKTTSTDWTVTLQSSYTATAQSSTSITGSFDDRHGLGGSGSFLPYRPHVEVYKDTVFGSFMFQDPGAPTP